MEIHFLILKLFACSNVFFIIFRIPSEYPIKERIDLERKSSFYDRMKKLIF